MRNLAGKSWWQTAASALAAMALAGCTSQAIVLPSGEKLSDSEAAIFKIDRSVKTDVQPELNGVIDLDARTIVLKSEPFKNYYEIRVAPGNYEVMLKVYSYGHLPAFPKARLRARAGMTYLFVSSKVLGGKAVNAEFKEVPTASLAEQEKKP
jgi:hypothetical protein